MFEQRDVPGDGVGDGSGDGAGDGDIAGDRSPPGASPPVDGSPQDGVDAAADARDTATVRELLEEIGAGIELLRECDPAVLVAELDGREPGPLRGAVLDGLDLDGLSAAGLLEVMKARAGQLAQDEAGQISAMAAFAARRRRDHAPGGERHVVYGPPPAPEEVSEWAAHEIAARLCLTRPSARNRMEHALDLTRRLPATLVALKTGRIDGHRAKVIAEGTQTLDDEQSAKVEQQVLPRAERQHPPGLRDSVKRAVLRLDPNAAKKRHQKAVADREVRVRPLEDGMAELSWTDRADRILAFSIALDALARLAKHGEHGDGRNMQQCRADVMTDLAQRLLDLDGLPSEHGHRPQVSIVMPLGTALRVTDDTAELIGYGPIPAELAQEIAADATWRRLLTDPVSGALLDVGRDKYRPPAALREHVLARDPYCTGLGCRVPARRCDLDHRIDWVHGGHTRANDLDALCRTHHRLKHEGGWARERKPDGSTVWRTPTGHQYTRDPDLLPGAKLPAEMAAFTPEHRKAIRDHARALGITVPSDELPDLSGGRSGVANDRATTNDSYDGRENPTIEQDSPPF